MSSPSCQLVGILTPVYNGGKYLAECIESVLGQSYPNWQYDIIDNCSTDDSLRIAERYAKQDSRIRVHMNARHVGRNANHNLAFAKLSSEADYCKVVHADDWLYPECLSKMVAVMRKNSSVGIVGAYALANDKVVSDGLAHPETVMSGKKIGRRTLLGGPYVFGSPTSLLFRAEIVRRRPQFFNEDNPHADKEACFEVLRNTDFGFVHQVLTFMRLHSGAASVAAEASGTFWLSDLEILQKYGSDYLSPEEFERAFTRQWKQYYTSMAKMVLLNRATAVWAYHEATLRRLGYTLSKGRLTMSILKELIEIALNPVGAIRRLVRVIEASSDRQIEGEDLALYRR